MEMATIQQFLILLTHAMVLKGDGAFIPLYLMYLALIHRRCCQVAAAGSLALGSNAIIQGIWSAD